MSLRYCVTVWLGFILAYPAMGGAAGLLRAGGKFHMDANAQFLHTERVVSKVLELAYQSQDRRLIADAPSFAFSPGLHKAVEALPIPSIQLTSAVATLLMKRQMALEKHPELVSYVANQRLHRIAIQRAALAPMSPVQEEIAASLRNIIRKKTSLIQDELDARVERLLGYKPSFPAWVYWPGSEAEEQ